MSDTVSLTNYRGLESVGEVIDLCRGFSELRPSDRVLIKPNLVGWDNLAPYPPWGVLTTSKVMEGLCIALKEAGVGDITIGEGSVRSKAFGSGTQIIYDKLGYEELVKRYGVRLVDFNECEYKELEIDAGHTVKITRSLDECDFIVNVPVLKTHGTTKVTLGMKNLKGLLSSRSKSYCHRAGGLLDHFIYRLAETFKPSLTLIDGIYANEQGPLHFGRALRFDLLLASKDIYAADLLGAYLIGYQADDVDHIREWAEKNGRSKDVRDLDLKGLDPEGVRRPLKWKFEWGQDGQAPDAFAKKGIKGVWLPENDESLCTGCSYMFNPLLLTILSLGESEFEGHEFLTGAKMPPSGNASKTFLVGKCQSQLNKDNPLIKECIEMKGCPPSLDEIEDKMKSAGMNVNRSEFLGYRKYIMDRYLKDPQVYPADDYYFKGGP